MATEELNYACHPCACLALPNIERLDENLQTARGWLNETDDDGSFEGLVVLDMFRAAMLDCGLTRTERARRLIIGMGWLSGYLADREDIPDHMAARASAIDAAVGNIGQL